ncbi:hypothetical protein COP2_025297 [Malus domestica]
MAQSIDYVYSSGRLENRSSLEVDVANIKTTHTLNVESKLRIPKCDVEGGEENDHSDAPNDNDGDGEACGKKLRSVPHSRREFQAAQHSQP